jgi:DNA (cytosine-5)-methyltransferase 1
LGYFVDMSINKKHFRFIDLFAGVGGLRIPFEAQGECVFTSEKDSSARHVYSENFNEKLEDIDTDISELGEHIPDSFPEHDLLLAGFPCQPFSHAGLRKGFDDIRGTLFFSIASIVEARRPKVVLLENVRGLKGHDHGFTFRKIKETIEGLGYVFHSKVLNARDFGLPQNRNRLFMVCLRDDLQGAFDFEFPKPTHVREELRVGDFLDSNVDARFTISDKLWEGHKRRKTLNAKNGKGFGYQLFNEDSHYVATISARYYKDGSEVLIEQKGENPRKLTPNEARRLQGFPEDFKLPNSEVQAYRQFGNAVPVNVIHALAKALKAYLVQ